MPACEAEEAPMAQLLSGPQMEYSTVSPPRIFTVWAVGSTSEASFTDWPLAESGVPRTSAIGPPPGSAYSPPTKEAMARMRSASVSTGCHDENAGGAFAVGRVRTTPIFFFNDTATTE